MTDTVAVDTNLLLCGREALQLVFVSRRHLLNDDMDASTAREVWKVAFRTPYQQYYGGTESLYELSPSDSMITPCPVKLASPCSCTHMTLSPNLQFSGEVLRRENCLARVLPIATGLTASTRAK
jgi:hypothetical protein